MDANEMNALYEKAQDLSNVEVKPGEMSPRERFFNTMEFKRPDRIIDTEFGYWNDTLRRWHNEGLPSWVNSNDKADIYFGFDVWAKHVPVKTALFPSFETVVLQDDGRHKIILDHERVKCEIFTDGTDTIPHYIEFPIKDRASYVDFKARLNPATPGRLPANLAEIGAKVKDRNYVLKVSGGSTAGWIRNWMGFEGIAMGIYDQPELLNEILDDISSVTSHIAREITKHMSIDLVSYWEDIAFKNGPIVTPDFFIDKCGAALNKAMSIYRANGNQYAFVDCDGDFRKLMPGWLNNGVNIMFPLEVAAGIHPGKLRRENPGIRMMGGVDKVVLLKGKSAIKKEMEQLRPLVEEGGFIPHVDHRVQADVPYQDYLYYLEVKRDFFGIPNRVAAD
ncbi:MAG: hypothetical protein V1913_00390 [Fibrobacterota bacterium]